MRQNGQFRFGTMKQGCEVNIVNAVNEFESPSEPDLRPIKFRGAVTEYSVFFVVSLICLSGGFVKELTGSMLDVWELAARTTLKPGYLGLLDIDPSALCIVWSLLLASVANFFGRKPVLYVAAVCGILSGFEFAYIDAHIVCSFIARALSSGVVVASYMICPLYMMEMVHDATRGFFTTGCSFVIFAGETIAFTFENRIPYPLFCAVLAILTCSFMFIFFWFPESPYFLAYKGKKLQAEGALQWMRRQDSEIMKPELAEIFEMVKPASNTNPCCSDSDGSSVGTFTALSLYILKATGGISATRNICGLVCSGQLFTDRDVHGIFLTLKLISSFLGSLAVDRAGRKMLLYFSYSGSCISFIVLILCYYNKSESFRVVSMVFLCVFAISYGIGYGTITPLVALELTPVPSRCRMMAISVVIESVLSICLMVSDQPIQKVLGPPINYIIPAIANALGVFFVWIVVPETTHKSLRDIQQIQIEI